MGEDKRAEEQESRSLWWPRREADMARAVPESRMLRVHDEAHHGSWIDQIRWLTTDKNSSYRLC